MISRAAMETMGREWVSANRDSYSRMKAKARLDAKLHPSRDLRIAAYCEAERARGISIPNAARAYLSRRIESELGKEGVSARFSKAKSKVDGLEFEYE